VGELIALDQYRHLRAGVRDVAAVEVAFDLGCAWTYLAAERIDRVFASVRWRPVMIEEGVHARRGEIEARAAQLRMPLVWPARASAWRGAMRVASYAVEVDRAREFVLAAGRLAYCGGFCLDDPDILAEAAAAACLPLDASMRAAADRERDVAMLAAGRELRDAGADRVPVLRVRDLLFCGEERLAEAAAAARAPMVASLHSRA
jgi:2-hydroxychromene-2-carboxylate isomerase